MLIFICIQSCPGAALVDRKENYDIVFKLTQHYKSTNVKMYFNFKYVFFYKASKKVFFKNLTLRNYTIVYNGWQF